MNNEHHTWMSQLPAKLIKQTNRNKFKIIIVSFVLLSILIVKVYYHFMKGDV